MGTLQEAMMEYRKQLEKGVIQQAYRGLMEYVMDLRAWFKNRYPDYFVSGGIYYGYMDMTYFSVIPESLKLRNLKIAVVFVYEAFRFEVWLAGYNKGVQAQYWKLIKESGWNQYYIVPDPKKVDAILVHPLVDHPDFGDLDALTRQIEREISRFIADVEGFFSEH